MTLKLRVTAPLALIKQITWNTSRRMVLRSQN